MRPGQTPNNIQTIVDNNTLLMCIYRANLSCKSIHTE